MLLKSKMTKMNFVKPVLMPLRSSSTQTGSVKRGLSFFRRHPLLANSLALGGLYSAAEISQQMLSKLFRQYYAQGSISPLGVDEKLQLKWVSIRNYGINGSLVASPLFRMWYKWLDGRIIGTSSRMIFRKLIYDHQ